MQFFKLNMKDNWEPSVGEVKLWEYRYVLSYVPFTLVIRLINCWDFIQIWYDNKMLSSQWDNDNQHFVYIIVSWYLLGIITRQGFLFSCSCMNRCTCASVTCVYRHGLASTLRTWGSPTSPVSVWCHCRCRWQEEHVTRWENKINVICCRVLQKRAEGKCST